MSNITSTKNRKFHSALLISLLVIFFLVFNRRHILNVVDPQPVIIHNSPNMIRAANPWNIAHADSCYSLLQDGDLVLRAGSDAISDLFKRVNSRDKSYSHAGLIFYESGYPMVYNSIGTAENPYAIVQRDSMKNFISPFDNTAYAIYRYKLNKREIGNLHDEMIKYYQEKRRFDPHFDLETDSLLYCTEIVYKGLEAATGQKGYLSTTLAGKFEFVAVDDLFIKSDIKLVCKIVYKQ